MGHCNVLHITPRWQVQWKINRIRRGGGSNHIRWACFAANVLHVVQGSQKPSIFAGSVFPAWWEGLHPDSSCSLGSSASRQQ